MDVVLDPLGGVDLVERADRGDAEYARSLPRLPGDGVQHGVVDEGREGVRGPPCAGSAGGNPRGKAAARRCARRRWRALRARRGGRGSPRTR